MLPRVAGFLVLAVSIVACSDGVLEYELDGEAVHRFESESKQIAARDDDNAPLLMSVRASNQIGAPPGVKVWNPEATLVAMGLKNGDLIALVDGSVPSQAYGSSFAANQEPFGSATEQYVDFVRGLLEKRHSQDSVMLNVHHEYRTIAEREKHGGIHTREATRIRVLFR